MKRVARLIGFISVCLFFLIFMAAAWPFLFFASKPKRMRLVALGVRLWARACLRVIGLKVNTLNLAGDLHSTRYLLVSNHQSYVDVVIIASVFPALFIAKTEVSRWPFIGWLARLGATIFVDREDARSGVSCAYKASRALRGGVNVQVFPESTTGDGTTVMPFKGLFFASAIRSQTAALPLTIKFQSVNGRPIDNETLDLMCWYGEADFAPHFWNLLKIESAEVALMINEPVKPVRAHGAKALAEMARERVFRSFANADAIADARAEVPVEFARAEANSRSDEQPDEQMDNGNKTAADFMVNAMLLSLFSPNRNELTAPASEIAPQSENDQL